MWFAKPIHSLTEAEKASWIRVPGKPLSQTLSWARGIEALSIRVFLVHSPEEGTGGIVFCSTGEDGKTHFECVNGPLLDWDDAERATRQLATFAMAVSKLDRAFGTLSLRPRWLSQETGARLEALPIEPTDSEEAATIQIPIGPDSQSTWKSLHPRLRRSVRLARENGVTTRWIPVEPGSPELAAFIEKAQRFAAEKDFTVPPKAWFDRLTDHRASEEGLSFALARANLDSRAEAELLVCLEDGRVHYLFGTERREDGVRAALSPAALAHWSVIERCTALGIGCYDLNGYVKDATPEHPYFGVCRFKEQFGGQVVSYEVPEFVIE